MSDKAGLGILTCNPDGARWSALSPQHRPQPSGLRRLLDIAIGGLPQFYEGGNFFHTARLISGGQGTRLRHEGVNLRYAAIVALGAACLAESSQRRALNGRTAAEFALSLAAPARRSGEAGAIALAAWASAEVAGRTQPELLAHLRAKVESGTPIETVICSWAMCAALASAGDGSAEKLRELARLRLMAAQGESGLFPHVLPASSLSRLRAHVGCYADMVYPVQALARLAAATGDSSALRAAEACAQRICVLQGDAGQWWWHYDVRTGKVVEGYPVYSVHQHAMGPMALFDLMEAGGVDRSEAIRKGLEWVFAPAEAPVKMISDEYRLVWRKIARREPAKLSRRLSAAASAILPGRTFPGIDLMFPPTSVDYECRPYELGWMLYAWLGGGIVSSLKPGPRP